MTVVALASPALAGPIETPIIGGTEATLGEFPTVVAIEVGNGLCTGTLITPDWVLTAAHCVTPSVVGETSQQAVTQSIRVHFNAIDINRAPGTVVMAMDSIPDPMFNVNALGQYDSGLIHLATSQTGITPVKLNFIAADAPVGVMVTMVGYGATAVGGTGTVGVEMVVMQQSIACAAQVGSDANLLCYSQTNGKGKCEGDSGGPSFAMQDGALLQVGITSFGDTNCAQFGADTRVDAEKPFITAHVPGLECNMDSDCTMGHECFQHGCIITPFSPMGLGATCTGGADCESGQCGTGDGGMKCTQACMPGATDACPSGLDCLANGSGSTTGFCWPHNAGGGCCDAGGASPSSIALALAVGALVMRRRRRG